MTDEFGIHISERGLIEPPMAGDEVATMLGSLERQRATLAWKCGGLDAEAMQVTAGASTITLGGLLKHLALAEEFTFSGKFLDRPLGAPWSDVDWEAQPDWEWTSAADDSPEELMARWRAACSASRAIVAEAMAGEGFDTLALRVYPDFGRPSLRRLVADMIEEYARHVGHADLIRESIDGLVGEDPPPLW